ncbi:MAG: hypothetical protein AABW53_00950 [Nanoarchaeota archaeon]
MIDKQKMEAEIILLQKEIEKVFLQLNEIDSRRADAKNLSQFKELTASSNVLLQNLMKDFHKILGYVLLIKSEGHRSIVFKSLLKRVRFMEELLQGLFIERQKQASLVSPLPEGKSGIVFWFNKKRLIHSLGEERDLMMVAAAVYKKEEVDEIRQTLNTERWKKRAMYTVAGGVFLVPGGAAISLAMLQAYRWANKSSKNYKKLLDLVK